MTTEALRRLLAEAEEGAKDAQLYLERLAPPGEKPGYAALYAVADTLDRTADRVRRAQNMIAEELDREII